MYIIIIYCAGGAENFRSAFIGMQFFVFLIHKLKKNSVKCLTRRGGGRPLATGPAWQLVMIITGLKFVLPSTGVTLTLFSRFFNFKLMLLLFILLD